MKKRGPVGAGPLWRAHGDLGTKWENSAARIAGPKTKQATVRLSRAIAIGKHTQIVIQRDAYGLAVVKTPFLLE